MSEQSVEALENGMPEGVEDAWLTYEMRAVILDYRRRYGLEATQQYAAEILNELAGERKQHGHS